MEFDGGESIGVWRGLEEYRSQRRRRPFGKYSAGGVPSGNTEYGTRNAERGTRNAERCMIVEIVVFY